MTDSVADQETTPLYLSHTPIPGTSSLPTVPPIRLATTRRSPFKWGRLLAKLSVMVSIALLSACAYWVISRYFVQTIEVVGESMVPTLQQGNHYILNRTAYHEAPPQRGDVVVIRDPADHGISVKRVIAVEGESIHFLRGKVYINGEALSEPYLLPKTYTFTYSAAKEQLITCGQGQYFVLGDNRVVSVDSRSYGPVSRRDILGQVILHK